MKKQNNIVIAYHKGCPDGFTGAWVAWTKFKKTADYVELSHQSLPPSLFNNKEIYMIDFAYPASLMKKIRKNAKKLIVLDHHISSKNDIKEADVFVFDNNKSGAVLAWEYFYKNKKIPNLAKYIQDRDLWTWKLPHSRELLSAVDLRKQDFKTWQKIAEDFQNAVKRKKYYQEGVLLLKYRDELVDRLVKNHMKASFCGHDALVVNSPIFESEIGGYLVEKGAKIVIIWRYVRDGIRVSLRSAKNVDVSKISEKYGGGGHKNASGFLIKTFSKIPWKYDKKQRK